LVDGGVGNISSPVVQAEVESPLDAVDFGFRP